MARIKFKKGQQRKFLKDVLEKINCPNLRSFSQFGFDIPYSTMKNYFSEKRTLPEEFFKSLIELSKIDSQKYQYKKVEDTWGQVKGGKISKNI